jgi:hypothetical protein
MGRLGWADMILRNELTTGDDASPGPRSGWNLELLDDPAFQDHLAVRFSSQRDVAAMYRELAEQAGLVLERIDGLLR